MDEGADDDDDDTAEDDDVHQVEHAAETDVMQMEGDQATSSDAHPPRGGLAPPGLEGFSSYGNLAAEQLGAAREGAEQEMDLDAASDQSWPDLKFGSPAPSEAPGHGEDEQSQVMRALARI